MVALPDTQHYSDNSVHFQQFIDQTEWILDERDDRNIVLVDHLGDIVDTSNATQWGRIEDAIDNLNQTDTAIGVAPGNHDYDVGGQWWGPALLYDQHFPATSAIATADGLGRTSYDMHPWYGGYMGGSNDAVVADQVGGYTDRRWKNNYVLFSVGGMDFINIALEYQAPFEAVDWTDAVLDQFPDRRAIISTHAFLHDDNTIHGGNPGALWTDVLSEHCNVFLVLSGHNHDQTDPTPGEGRRTESNDCGDDVHMLLSDYQNRANGGDGWLRIMTFDPTNDTIDVETYSPTRNGGAGDYETDSSSEFTLDYDMDPAGEWVELGTDTVVGGVGAASLTWDELLPEEEYEWYVVAGHDGDTTSTIDDPWSFTTPDLDPLAIENVVLTPQAGSVLVEWDEPVDVGSVLYYRVRSRPIAGGTWTDSGQTWPTNSASVTGLDPAVGYEFVVIGKTVSATWGPWTDPVGPASPLPPPP